MADVVSRQKRSLMMAGIGSKNTKPEIIIRKALHQAGYRYSLHRKDLPGSPDLVFKKYKAVIFINGCFWHGHDCHLFKWPKTRPDFWKEKIEGNMARDIRNTGKLAKTGWRQLIIWECGVKGKSSLTLQEIVDLSINWLHSDDIFTQISGKCRK